MENNEAEKISLERKAIETKNAHNQINTDRKTALTNLNILLSILVPTVPNRLDNFYPRIMRELLKQINDNDLNDNVELIAFFDNKKRTIGKKRGEMVNLAKGEYIIFVDDDDRVAPNYVIELVNAILAGNDPDCIVFDVICTVNDARSSSGLNVESEEKLCQFSVHYEYGDVGEMNGMKLWRGKPAHVMAWRSTISKKHLFLDLQNGEDMDWVVRACSEVKREHRIPKVLYYYDACYHTTSETSTLNDAEIIKNLQAVNDDIIRNENKITMQSIEECYKHVVTNKLENIELTIVMTTYNRIKQTLKTLQVINDLHKNKNYNIQIIIVDDSEHSLEKYLETFSTNIQVDYIHISRKKKTWVNPCVNYNIGFKYVLGEKIIIQNAEVCHVGDVVDFVFNNVHENKYYVFDVKASTSLETNTNIYKYYDERNSGVDCSIYDEPFFSEWYQNGRSKNYMMHFLVAMNKDSFTKMGRCFDENYKDAIDYDDNDFLMRILVNNITPQNIYHSQYNIGGIHLFHPKSFYNRNLPTNEQLFFKKLIIYLQHDKYIEKITDLLLYNIPLISSLSAQQKQQLVADFYKKNNIELFAL